MADTHHYTALYNVVTNLILYQDPEQRQRSQKMDTFVYSFDRRDARRYVTEVAQLQQRIRESESLIKAYEEHYMHLAREGKLGLIDIRADLLASVENLNMIYDTVSLQRNYTERAAALKGSIRLQAHAEEVAWYMFGTDTLLAKIAMTGTRFNWLRKKDSSTDSSLVVADMQALNSSPDAIFPEMLAKYSKGNGRGNKVSCDTISRHFLNHCSTRFLSKPIMNVQWAVLAPVGGITIMERMHVDLHPIRVQIEKKVGRQLMDYVFAESKARKIGANNLGGKSNGHSGLDDMTSALEASSDGRKHRKPSGDQRDNQNVLSRQSSFSETTTADADNKQSRRSSTDSKKALLHPEANEMHDRATKNLTFVSIDFVETTLVLSYKVTNPRASSCLYYLD
jgi:hypothetical protein